MTARKAGSRSSRRGARALSVGLGMQRLDQERCQRRQRQSRNDEPDQVPRRNEVGGKAGEEAAGDEGKRAPQPDRAVGAAARRQAFQRIGLGQAAWPGQAQPRRAPRRPERPGTLPRARPRHSREWPAAKSPTSPRAARRSGRRAAPWQGWPECAPASARPARSRSAGRPAPWPSARVERTAGRCRARRTRRRRGPPGAPKSRPAGAGRRKCRIGA